MKYKHCPRCELNYIFITEDYCEFCLLEMKGENLDIDSQYCAQCGVELDVDETDICSSCRESLNNCDDNATTTEEI